MAVYTAVDDPSAFFKVQLYSGNGAANNAITFDDTDTDMQPDLVWIKNRDTDDSNCVFDSVRGATKILHTDANSAEATDADTLDSFASDGFQVDADVKVNTDGEAYVAWCWKESNTTAGFDIVQFEGTGSAHTEAHSLSAVPHLIIFKGLEVTDNWDTFHTSLGPEVFPYINSTAVPADQTAFMNDTAPTSSVFTVGDATSINTDDKDTIAYCWTAKQGFSKFGAYVGNGDADGPFVYTGFRPSFVFGTNITDAGNHWFIWDNERPGYNGGSNWIKSDYAQAELTNLVNPDFLANGFKIRSSDGIFNNSGSTFIWMAFAETPFVNSNGVPCNAR